MSSRQRRGKQDGKMGGVTRVDKRASGEHMGWEGRGRDAGGMGGWGEERREGEKNGGREMSLTLQVALRFRLGERGTGPKRE
jgi:hypothetical protein